MTEEEQVQFNELEVKARKNAEACAKWKAKKAMSDPDYERKRQANYYARNKEKIAAKNKKWVQENREHYNELCNDAYHKFKHNKQAAWNSPENKLLVYAKKRAKKYNREFNIELSDIVIPEVCPVLGIPIIVKQEVADGKHIQDNSPSLDRIDNSKGYVKGNVEVISYKANRLKGHGSLEDFQKVVAYLLKSA